MEPHITWLGHDGFLLAGTSATVCTDPYQVGESPQKADIILISHSHHDHCSPDDVARVAAEKPFVVATPDCEAMLAGYEMHGVRPGSRLEHKGVTIEAIPAYNTNKSFHPRKNNWVGYIITLDSTRIYFAGDTDRIEEMKGLQDIDIAFLPVSGTYVMTAQEAAMAALDIAPRRAIPMHFGGIVGTRDDADTFASALAGKIPVTTLDVG